MNAGNEAIDRMAKKGGRSQFSLRRGSFVQPTGEKETVISEPMSDEDWHAHLQAIGAKPDLIHINSSGEVTEVIFK